MKLVEARKLEERVCCQEASAQPTGKIAVLDYMRKHRGMTEQEAEKQLDGVVLCKEKVRSARSEEELTTEAITCYIANQSHCPLHH